jgi:hypothetical protein
MNKSYGIFSAVSRLCDYVIWNKSDGANSDMSNNATTLNLIPNFIAAECRVNMRVCLRCVPSQNQKAKEIFLPSSYCIIR